MIKKNKIVIIGVGDSGCNIVNCIASDKTKLINYFVVNTDMQFFQKSNVSDENYIIFDNVTRGLGTGGNIKIGQKSAEENIEKIKEIIKGADVVFIIAGLGGGTGTGIAPVIAKICHENKILTISIVTRPFNFENKQIIANSIIGLNLLKENTDSLIIISNDKLLINKGDCSITTAFDESNKVLIKIVDIITDLILLPGIININLADLRNILNNSGITIVGFGSGKGNNKIVDAAENTFFSPLIEVPISSAKKIICAIFCGSKISLIEAQKCIDIIKKKIGSEINIKLSILVDKKIVNDEITIGIIACDFSKEFDINNVAQNEIKNEVKTDIANKNSENNNQVVNNFNKNDNKNNEQIANIEDNIIEDEILPSFLKNE